MKQKLLIIKKQATKRKNNWNFFLRNTCRLNKSNYLCTRNQEITDSQSTTLLMLGSWVRAPAGSLKIKRVI